MRVERNVKRLRPASRPSTTHTVRFPAAVFFRKEATMRDFLTILMVASTPMVSAAEPPDWWNPQWQFRTMVERPGDAQNVEALQCGQILLGAHHPPGLDRPIQKF